MRDKLLKAGELAEMLGVAKVTIAKWAKDGLIPQIRPTSRSRRFDYAEVVDALKEHRGGGRSRNCV